MAKGPERLAKRRTNLTLDPDVVAAAERYAHEAGQAARSPPGEMLALLS